MATRIQLRRDSAADWTTANPILAQGEMGLELDTGKVKFGDGITAWNSLPYFAEGGGGSGTVTSVAVSVPTGLEVSGSPVTTSGTIEIDYESGYQGYTADEASKLSGIEAGAEVNAVDSVNGQTGAVDLDYDDVGAEQAFSKGNLVAGTGVTLDGTLTGRLVGSGNVTVNASGGGGGGDAAYTSALTGTAYDVDDYTSGQILRMENTAAATVTVIADATQYDTWAEYGIHALGSETVTVVADTGVTVDPPPGGSLVLNPGDFAILKRRGTDLWALIAPTDAPTDGRTYGRRDGLWAPFERPSAIAMTAALSAVNAHLMNVVIKGATGNLTYTLSPTASGTFEPTVGDVIAWTTNNTGNLVISRGSGVSLYYLGTNQNVTLTGRGRGLSAMFMGSNVWNVLA